MSIVYIVSAPSGSGKSTLVARLLTMVRNLDFSISYTTRPPRGPEQNRKEYFFVSREEFKAMIDADEFLEYADVFGNYYGTARRFLREAEEHGHDLLLDIDVQGASQIMRRIPRCGQHLYSSAGLGDSGASIAKPGAGCGGGHPSSVGHGPARD